MTLGTLSVTCLGVGLTACNYGNGNDVPAHHWATEWSKDDVNHWHECTDDNCDLIYQVAPHDFTNGDCVCGQPKPSSGNPDDDNKDPDDDNKDEDGILSISACGHTQNGSRITQLVQKLYKVGDTVNHNNISVQVTKRVNGKEITENVKTDITYEDPDMTAAGEKQVKVKYGGKETTYTINVMDLSGVSKNAATVTVNASASYGVSGDVVTVKSINDAVSVFKLLGTDDNTTKTINVAEGVYHEKVEFDIPNLHIVGAAEDASKTVIEFDLIAEYKCPGTDAAYSTDGSATVSVRAAAIGFHAENITFQNYWNTHERYLQSKDIANALVPANESRNGNTMAVACLVQADMCVFDNVRFSSYHDTLYDYNGRHVYNNCFIEGRTDYVFGYGATSYFNNCTLNTIGANDDKNGGYVCATMGYSKYTPAGQTPTTVIDYGYIFKGCTFTADSRVVDGTVSLARAWSSYMTLAFIECDISSAYSKTAYGTKVDGKNERYGKMSSGEPDAERLYEYGNTGAGALDYATLGTGKQENLCTVLTEEQKNNFCNFNVIFAAKNGQIEYSSAWNGNAGVTVPATYNFADFAQGSSTSTNGQFVDFFDGAVSVKGTYWMNGSAMRLNVGDTVKINVQGKITVDWYGGVYGTAANGKITYKDGYATLTIVEDTASTNGIYIKSITVDGTQEGVHEHSYGNWVIASEPTATTGGTATRTCTDCELATPHSVEVQLPRLSEDDYTITASQNAGKAIYTLKTESSITFEADALAGIHVHHYGAWTVSLTPTATAVGAVTRACEDADCNHDSTATESKELPTLGDARYTITDNTADLNNGGTGTYTIKLDGIDEPVSFTAETSKLEARVTYDLTKVASKNVSGTSSEPASLFDGVMSMVGSMRFQNGTGAQVNKGTVITLNVKGTVEIVWFGGGYGTEADGKVTYKDGYATIEIIGAGTSGNGAYIKTITVDRGDIPADTAMHTVTVYAEDCTTVLGTIPSLMSGDKITLAQIQELVSGGIIDKVYTSAAKTEEFDFDTGISSDLQLYITVLETVELETLTDYTLSIKSELSSSATAVIDGVVLHNNNYLLLGGGSSIKIKVKAGSVIMVYGDQYVGSAVKFNDIAAVKTDDNTFVYTAGAADEEVTITSAGSTYIRCLNVNCNITYNTGDVILLGEYPGQCTNSKAAYHGVEIDATASGNAKWDGNKGTSGGYAYAQTNADTKLTFKVADGITADNVKVYNYNGVLTADTEYSITVENGVVTVVLLKNCYICRIEIA